MKIALSPLPARIRSLPAQRLDLLLAAAVLVEGLLELLLGGDPHWGAVPILVAIAAAVLVRRRLPVGAVALAIAAVLATTLLPEQTADGLGGPFLVVVFLVFSMAMRVEGARLYAGAAIAFAGIVAAGAADQYPSDAADYFLGLVLFCAAPVAAGRLLRSRIELTRALREKAAAASRGRDLRSEDVTALERTRIAGELHDVVAHALGAMTVQAAGARRLALQQPERAGEALMAVEATGREALGELRRLLGVLRREDEELALAPQPRLSHLGDLVQRAGMAGLPVGLKVSGDERQLPAGVDLTAYRVVQEALEEALFQGHALHADVTVRYGREEIWVEVVDDGSAAARRLLGMRERVRVYGGDLLAEPRRGGGHRVRARLPVEGHA